MGDTNTEEKKEEKTSAPASEQEKQSDEQKVDDTTGQADDQQNDQEDDQIDHAAEAEKLRKQLGQAEHTIQELRKDKKAKPEDSGEQQEDDVDAKIDKRFSALEQRLAAGTVASVLATLSNDPSEREHIMLIYENKIRKTGVTPEAILSDLEDAKILANRKRILRENSEIKRAVAEKKTITNSGKGQNQDRKEPESTSQVKVSAEEAALLARRGLKPSDVKVSPSTAAKR